MKQKSIIIILMLAIIITGCSLVGIYPAKSIIEKTPVKYQKGISQTLEKAGKNKKELLKVLYHYQNNPQKLEAAAFLIANMQDHQFADVIIVDSLDNEIVFDVLDFENYHKIVDYLDSLETTQGELHWKVNERRKDAETISSELLIKHIDLAVTAYETLPWTHELGWKTFMEFVLPYRGSSEPLSDWRTYFWNEFSAFRDSTSDPITLANLINNKCREMFKFKDVYYLHPTDQSLEEMLETGYGRCEDMTNFTIYATRANGLAVTSDYTPHWPDGSNNHAWNAIILSEDKAIPFMGAEADPGEYSLGRKVAKVYRKLFFEEENSLGSKMGEGEKAPPWLSGKNYRDVTDQYTETTDVNIVKLESEKKWAYLAVFNSNKWKAIQWAEIDSSGNAVFTSMGKDIAYLPMYYVQIDSADSTKDKSDDDKPKYELKSAGNPFILTEAGSIEKFDDLELDLRPIIKDSIIIKKIAKNIKVKPEINYEFFIWENGNWNSLQDSIKVDTTAVGDSLIFDHYFQNSLYKLQDDEDNEEVRIFTIEERKQKIW
ncbi:MAG: transglutaminase-like domain-containing protein [Candidatus Cloacimonadota bacterium]|nr:transglutaminase-like domain-containing protein [Candidatus Cloacimonadota bacterium]